MAPMGGGPSKILLSAKLDPLTVVAIGSSTGGTEALRELLVRLPANMPPIVVAQHIPPIFSRALAERLHSLCRVQVREAKDGDELLTGCVLIAPGNTQMTVERFGAKMRVKVDPLAAVRNRHKPSVDVLFESVAAAAGAKAIGMILTGMGSDGAEGLLRMRNMGAYTLAQDEASCVVYGMPQAAVKLGAVEKVLSLLDMPAALVNRLDRRQAS